MAEAAFARTFLSTLDARPIKLSADHVEDPKYYPARPPYILPRMAKPMSKPKTLAPGQERSVTVVLKSLRNPPLDIKLTSQPLNTSLLDIKTKISSQTRIPVDKMKILHNKRPLTDSKILKEVLGETDMSVEFSVMVIGGAAAIPPEETASPASRQPTGTVAVDSDAFWVDLKGFLMQRLNDQATAEELSRLFRASWESNKSGP
ncbi:get5 carboxyl domain-containing protein [Hirsutella rhossiliensis]|uniref:Get5 carboxyl domain-containing protein n=1 Tax=Hirsutella rhossiliensis TaxID=111463 RepID=A0A9P8SM83_9HYPO|nr:get5 carboxyl domain-containing protein [Hirsutella rhossiliensis]KAH0967069.1 get5 carboxyl domain-containing protein [Hirsutella rhossiliensis]